MRMTVQQLLQDGGTPEYMYHDRTAWPCAFLWAKNMEAKNIHKEMLPIWAASGICQTNFAACLLVGYHSTNAPHSSSSA
jgi:hypothetical protein